MLLKNPLTHAEKGDILDQVNTENELTEIVIKRNFLSYFPVFISLAVTLFGVLGFLATFIPDDRIIYAILLFFASLILIIEHNRTHNIADFLGSLLAKNVDTSVTIPYFGLFVSVLITGLFIAMDLFGSLTLSSHIERLMVDGIVKSSEAYHIEKEKAESGANEKKLYNEELALWRKDRDAHYLSCDKKWIVPKYRTRNESCRDKFTQSEPVESKAKGVIDREVYTELEDKAKEEVAGYRVYFFKVFLALSIFLNYLAMVGIINQYRAKKEALDPDMILELQNRFEEIKTARLRKAWMSTNVMVDRLEEKNIIDVGIEEQSYDIMLARRKVVESGRSQIPHNIVKDIPMMGHSKSAFIETSLSNTSSDLEIIKKLFRGGSIKKGQKLVLKKHIVNYTVRGSDRKFRNLMLELVGLNYIEYRKNLGYYALEDYETVLKGCFPDLEMDSK